MLDYPTSGTSMEKKENSDVSLTKNLYVPSHVQKRSDIRIYNGKVILVLSFGAAVIHIYLQKKNVAWFHIYCFAMDA